MEKLLIVGAGGLGRMTLEHAQTKYDCYFVDDAYNQGDIICDTQIVGKILDLKLLSKIYKYLICAIGNNKLREEITNIAINYGYTIPNIIADSVYISNYAKMGFGNILLNNVCIQNGAALGNGIVITANSEIHHDCQIGDYSLIYSCSVIRTYAKIGKRVKVGSTVSISNDVIIDDDSVIENGEVR